jgi:hypothetical protein
MPLQGPAVLVTALAIDSLALRRQLDAALAAVESALAPVGNQDACLMRTSAIASDSG